MHPQGRASPMLRIGDRRSPLAKEFSHPRPALCPSGSIWCNDVLGTVVLLHRRAGRAAKPAPALRCDTVPLGASIPATTATEAGMGAPQPPSRPACGAHLGSGLAPPGGN